MADLAQELRTQARNWARAAAADMLRQTDRKAPVDTGQLKGTGDIRQTGDTKFEIRYPADYASYTDTGTRPHVIVPRRARVLRFTVGGTTLFRPRVNHPGTKGTRWFSSVVTEAGWRAAVRRVVGPRV